MVTSGWKKRLLAVVGSAALAAGGAAVGGSLAPPSSGSESSVAFASPQPLPLTRGDSSKLVAAPDFRIRTTEGRTLMLSDMRGRPTVLFFMAYWCSTCVHEARALDRISSEFAGQGLQVFAVDIDPTSSPEALESFRDFAGKPSYTFALDVEGNTARAFKVATLDTTIVIDTDGRITYRDSSLSTYEMLRDALRTVI